MQVRECIWVGGWDGGNGGNGGCFIDWGFDTNGDIEGNLVT